MSIHDRTAVIDDWSSFFGSLRIKCPNLRTFLLGDELRSEITSEEYAAFLISYDSGLHSANFTIIFKTNPNLCKDVLE